MSSTKANKVLYERKSKRPTFVVGIDLKQLDAKRKEDEKVSVPQQPKGR